MKYWPNCSASEKVGSPLWRVFWVCIIYFWPLWKTLSSVVRPWRSSLPPKANTFWFSIPVPQVPTGCRTAWSRKYQVFILCVFLCLTLFPSGCFEADQKRHMKDRCWTIRSRYIIFAEDIMERNELGVSEGLSSRSPWTSNLGIVCSTWNNITATKSGLESIAGKLMSNDSYFLIKLYVSLKVVICLRNPASVRLYQFLRWFRFLSFIAATFDSDFFPQLYTVNGKWVELSWL